jgi:hypothetical protein
MNLSQQLVERVGRALAAGHSPWLAFFAMVVELNLGGPFAGMTQTADREQIAGWLRTIPNFPAQKIGSRLDRISSFATRGSAAASLIAGDFEGFIGDLQRAA